MSASKPEKWAVAKIVDYRFVLVANPYHDTYSEARQVARELHRAAAGSQFAVIAIAFLVGEGLK